MCQIIGLQSPIAFISKGAHNTKSNIVNTPSVKSLDTPVSNFTTTTYLCYLQNTKTQIFDHVTWNNVATEKMLNGMEKSGANEREPI